MTEQTLKKSYEMIALWESHLWYCLIIIIILDYLLYRCSYHLSLSLCLPLFLCPCGSRIIYLCSYSYFRTSCKILSSRTSRLLPCVFANESTAFLEPVQNSEELIFSDSLSSLSRKEFSYCFLNKQQCALSLTQVQNKQIHPPAMYSIAVFPVMHVQRCSVALKSCFWINSTTGRAVLSNQLGLILTPPETTRSSL